MPFPRVRQARFCKVQGTLRGVAHYLFNFVNGDAAKGPALREQAAGFLRVRMWGVDAALVEEWDPPVPMNTVLSQIDPGENAKADCQAGVVRITAHEYETALAVGAGRSPSTT